MNRVFDFSAKMSRAYCAVCKPLCRELGLPQTAFDILMFLGNNPEYHTARDIVETRHIPANLVSVHVDRLVREGYLTRQQDKCDRRKTMLLCTGKAQSVIARGRQLQNAFFERTIADTDENARNAFLSVLETIEKNLDKILENEAVL